MNVIEDRNTDAVDGLGPQGPLGLRLRRRPRSGGVVKDMMGALVRAILFGIGVEIGRDIYKKLKGEGAEGTPPPEPPRPDPEAAEPPAADEPPADEPPADGDAG